MSEASDNAARSFVGADFEKLKMLTDSFDAEMLELKQVNAQQAAELDALRGVIRSLRNMALLNNIDQSQVIDAMKAWDLIDETGQPTALLTGENE